MSLERCAAAVVMVCLLGCGSSSIPDPKEAALAYADAAGRGDSEALHGMLSDEARRSLSREEVRRMVADERAELVDRSRALKGPGVSVKTSATVRYGDGESAVLELAPDGRFRVASSDALPAGARTPVQALEQLRRVLARRSYAGLIRVLSPSTRSAVEADLRSLVEGLERPEGLDVQVAGDTATVQIPGGHEVKLKREAGIWHVEDFQ